MRRGSEPALVLTAVLSAFPMGVAAGGALIRWKYGLP